jgi:hypothetical protein
MATASRVALLVFGVCVAAGLAGAQSPAATTPPTKAEWREDLRYFARELPRRHKNAFHTTTRQQFESDVAALDAAIDGLQDHQIIVKLRQISATVGDGHTGVRFPSTFKRYPINLYWFGNELRVIAAAKDHTNMLGARVVKIGDLGIDEVATRVATCFPSKGNENDWFVMNNSPAFIVRPEVLHALGVVPDLARATFTLEDDSKQLTTVEVTPVVLPPAVKGVITLGLTAADAQPPLYRQKLGEPFWFTHLPESHTTYVNFKRYPSLGQNAQTLFASVDRNRPQRLVIDLRQNGGGDFTEGRDHLIDPIKRRSWLNQPGRLFVIVGRQTFSAAMVNAIDFRKQTRAMLVGEPIGERPNSYSENDEMTLPHSKLVVSYSTRYYQFVDEDVPAVLPDQRIDPTWEDFRAGRDAALEWILARPLP